MLESLKKILLEMGVTLSVAESCTAGKLQDLLTSISGSSDYFEGGITTYNIDQKVKHLNVNREDAEKVDCVSQEIADQMAIGCSELFETRLSISTTGYINTHLFYSICFDNEIVRHGKIELSQYRSRSESKNYSPITILEILIDTLNNINDNK